MSLGIVLRNFIRLGYNGKLVQHPFGKKKKKEKLLLSTQTRLC